MNTAHQIAISRGHDPKDAFLGVVRAAGYTQNSLAAKVGISAALMSFYRNAERAIPRALAGEIQTLVGWPADEAHWPGGVR